VSALTKLLRRRTGGARRRGLLRRAAPIWLGLVVTVGSAIPPATGDVVPWLPTLPEIPIANAGYPCSSHSGEFPMFTGKLSNSSGTMLTESTTGVVYGRISNIDERWQPTPGCGYYRYDGIIWAQANGTSNLKVHWGALSGDGLACNWIVGTTDYIHANGGACPTTETQDRMTPTLAPDWWYQNDVALDDKGDFAFAHSDCIDWYTKNVPLSPATTSLTNSKPGANCGYKQLDGTNTSQTLVVDGTAPTVSFSYPPAGGPTLNPAAWTSVVFNATDAVAGFFGTDDWDLQRQWATWTTSCGTTWTNDGTAVSGTTSATGQVRSQSLALGKCYRWILSARDQNGNTASVTSGTIRTDTSGVWGDQPQFRFETFDLGAGDTLAVSTGSANVRLTHPIVSLPIRNGTLDLVASYNSHDGANVGMGPGWRLNVQRRLTVDPATGNVTFTAADGSRHTFTSPTGSPTVTYTRPATLYATLVRDTAATPDRFTLTYRDQSKDVFDENVTNVGVLKEIKDRHGNSVSVAYGSYTPYPKISTLTDPSGSRTVTASWTGDNLTSVVDWANVAGGIVQTSGSGNRTHRFFYDAVSPYNLIGWADPLNTSGTCPTAASHRTCLTYSAGFLSAVARKHTYATLSGGAITTGTWTTPPTTSLAYAAGSADVASVTVSLTDAVNAVTTFCHPDSVNVACHPTASPAGQTKVVRPGTPASETTYTLVSMSDQYGRASSVKRKLASAQVETRTAYDATYPIDAASVTENYVNGVGGDGVVNVEDRITNYTYQGSSLGLLSRLDEPLDGTYRRFTDFTYNSNNDVTRKLVYSTDAATDQTETRSCYTTSGCSTSATDLLLRATIENYKDGTAGGTNGHVEDVTTTFLYDAYGQRTRSTRTNYSGSTLLDSAATGWTYDIYGSIAAEVRNYADGLVDCSTDDETPNATTNARTDLTTVYAYDTAGNRVSVADPRSAIALDADVSCTGPTPADDDYISRTVYNALNEAVTTRLPTALIVPGQSDCSPTPACRESTTAYDEFGLVREFTDFGGLMTATNYDKAGLAAETYEDSDGAGGTAAGLTSKADHDAQGRTLWTEDRIQANDPAGGADPGRTEHVYDELGRVIKTTEAAGSSPDIRSETTSSYDNLDRRSSETIGANLGPTGAAQTTSWTYDIGGRVTEQNDEFTCVAMTWDYRGLALTVVEGKTPGAPCTGSGTRTITNAYDGLGRLLTATVGGSGDLLMNDGYDGAGRRSKASETIGTTSRTTDSTFNPLDETIIEYRYKKVGSTVSEETWLQANYDPVGNNTDRCTWLTSPSTACLPADQTMNPEPTKRTTTGYDARNNRISLLDPAVGEATYDPAANYLVKGIFTKTANGKEHQAIHVWDARNRLDTITHYLCATAERPVCSGTNILSQTVVDDYDYDDNDNRTKVAENNGGTSSTKYYCYDALNRLTGTYSATNCSSPLETYAYDAAGNRTSAAVRGFTYDVESQLASCSSPSCTATHDAEGRLTQLVDNGTTWTYQYDAEGRLTAACKASACSGSINRLDFAYGEEDQRVQVKEMTSGGQVTTTDLRYEGRGVIQEVTSTGITRTFTLDEAGAIVKLVVAGDTSDPDNDGTYLVTWNGHGDALALWKIDLSSGALTLANTYAYSTWGQPTTTTHNGIGDLGFRYLYVGQFGVAWDGFQGVNLHFMGSRVYSPTLGRFIQPDPSRLESNPYRYAGNNPVTYVDPSGKLFWFVVAWVALRVAPLVMRAVTAAALSYPAWASKGQALATAIQRTPPPSLLQQSYRIAHIVENHASWATVPNKSHFFSQYFQNWTATQRLVEGGSNFARAWSSIVTRANGYTVVTHSQFPYNIGTTQAGTPTRWVTYIWKDNYLWTMFPGWPN
jgi:RHS repeat-associated protein